MALANSTSYQEWLSSAIHALSTTLRLKTPDTYWAKIWKKCNLEKQHDFLKVLQTEKRKNFQNFSLVWGNRGELKWQIWFIDVTYFDNCTIFHFLAHYETLQHRTFFAAKFLKDKIHSIWDPENLKESLLSRHFSKYRHIVE